MELLAYRCTQFGGKLLAGFTAPVLTCAQANCQRDHNGNAGEWHSHSGAQAVSCGEAAHQWREGHTTNEGDGEDEAEHRRGKALITIADYGERGGKDRGE